MRRNGATEEGYSPDRSLYPLQHSKGNGLYLSIGRVIDFGISSVFRLSFYIYWLMVGRYPNFIEEEISIRVAAKACQYEKENAKQLQTEIQKVTKEKDNALKRLSEAVSVKLRDNNPNIADLNDQYRPTKLADMFSELYDNEWTGAYGSLEKELGETHTVRLLLKIMMEAYGFCEKSVAEPWNIVAKWFLDMSLPGAQQTSKWLKDSRKAKVFNRLPEVIQDFKNEVDGTFKDNKEIELFEKSEVEKYLEKCIEVSLLMVTTDPPVIVQCPQLDDDRKHTANTEEVQSTVGEPSDSSKDDKDIDDDEDQDTENVEKNKNKNEKAVFDKNQFREYTERGKYFNYIIWPALLLHKDGPLLSKGVAQGTDNAI